MGSLPTSSKVWPKHHHIWKVSPEPHAPKLIVPLNKSFLLCSRIIAWRVLCKSIFLINFRKRTGVTSFLSSNFLKTFYLKWYRLMGNCKNSIERCYVLFTVSPKGNILYNYSILSKPWNWPWYNPESIQISPVLYALVCTCACERVCGCVQFSVILCVGCVTTIAIKT